MKFFFVNYLASHKLKHICSFVPKTSKQKNSDFVHFRDKFSVVVISWVNGENIVFTEFEWMQNQKIVFAWGRFFAEMHEISRNFEQENLEVA